MTILTSCYRVEVCMFFYGHHNAVTKKGYLTSVDQVFGDV